MKLRVEDLTLREKIGQTVIFHQYENWSKIDDPESYFTQNPIGAMWTLSSPKEIYLRTEAALGNPDLKGRRDEMFINSMNYLNRFVRVPILPVMDASCGISPKMFEDHPELPTAASLGATRDADLAYEYGKNLGEDLRSINFRWIWSPVADNAGHFNGTRALSSDSENNARLLTAFIHGVQSAGVATGAKHFPGPDPYDKRDSHFCTASYSQSFEYWKNHQAKDFQACIDAGVDSIMIRHCTFKAVDDTRVNGALLPCTLSHKVVTGLLKGEMGFEGVVLTDDVSMKALATIYTPDKLYVELLRAGIDMVLGPTRLDYIDIVEAAVLSGDLPESRIDDACRRILKMKERYGLLEHTTLPLPTEEKRAKIRAAFQQTAEKIASKGITLTANRTHFLPLKPDRIRKVKIVYIGYSDRCYDNLKYAVAEFQKHGAECDLQRGFERADNDTLDQYDLILYATFIGFHAPVGGQLFFGQECHMMRRIMTKCTEKSMAVSFGNTDIFFNYFTAAHTFVNCYSLNRETMVGLVKGIYGELQFTDYNPFPLNPIYCNDDVYA